MWTDENRGRTDRSELRYPSDLTDHERTLVEPEIPRARRGGKPKKGVRIDRPGFDGTKEIKGKKRHVLVDTQSPLMEALVQAADIQDRDGGVLPVASLFGLHRFLLKLHADAGYQGPKFRQGPARVRRHVNAEIVRRCDTGKFVVLPKRWIVERAIAWLNRCRRPSKDWECPSRNALAFLRWTQVRLMLRRLRQNIR